MNERLDTILNIINKKEEKKEETKINTKIIIKIPRYIKQKGLIYEFVKAYPNFYLYENKEIRT